jgi:ribosomal-protein-alanine N-acetyltransferase
MLLAEDHVRESCGESITLEVRTHNTAAIAMYTALGYQRAGIRRRYYADGQDALVMTKSVEPG